MKALVIGSGGREHALCWALSRSATVFCGPGNPGTEELATNLALDPGDPNRVLEAIREQEIDLTIIGPEAPLAGGLVDRIEEAGFKAFGPTAAAAKLEASKSYAKEVMASAGVPTAASTTFTELPAAERYIESHGEPLVVKASGLAAGKGAIVCQTRRDARQAAADILGGRFGDAGREIVVEEFLEGEELSILALTDGEELMLLPSSQDHKRLGEGDVGPNTGGMGAYTPVSIVTPELLQKVIEHIMRPVLAEMGDRGAPYRGVLYAGLMIDSRGEPSVVEFNCRMGDPEAQAVLPAVDQELAEHFWSIAARERWSPKREAVPPSRSVLTTILAAPGYPERPQKGTPVRLPKKLPEGALLFQAGTSRDADGSLRSAGGRVLCATGVGADLREARKSSLALADAVDFDGKVFRRDIGWRELERAGAT